MRHFFLILFLLHPFALPGQGKIASARLEPTPLVARTPEGDRQVILAEIVSDGLQGVTYRASKADWPQPVQIRIGDIAAGKQVVKLQVPVASTEGPVSFSLEASGLRMDLPEARLKPPQKWMVYLVQHTHTDIGYTRPQTEILPEHLRYIDTALDFCDLTDGLPDDARFRWTCEVSWAVREYLKRRPPTQIERLKRRVAEGRIELTAMFLNMSEIADEASLAASLEPLREIQGTFGKVVRAAMQDDVNGAAWCLPDYFSGIGVRYLTMGINKTRSILPFDKPTAFWWESPAGKRILAFRPDHYMTGNFWKIHEGRVESIEPGLAKYLNNLGQAGYPFDRIAVQFSGYSTDNSPPAMKECALVKAWNEAYAWPRLRLATVGEFLEYLEKSHASELAVHRQAWPDWWTDGFGSAARETAAARETHAAMQVNEGLLAMASVLGNPPSPSAAQRVASIQEALLFYDEHTFGAAESISHPEAENSMVQWGEKSAYAWEAVKNAGLLREEALGLLQPFITRADKPTIAVFNTLGWTRSGLIQAFIDHEILPADRKFRILDSQSGAEIPAQRMRGRAEGSYWAFWVKDVPAMGFKSFRIEVAPENLQKPKEARPSATVLENSFYRLEISPRTGAVISLLDRETGRQLVDAGAPWHLGQFIYERAVDRADFDRPSFPKEHPFQRIAARKVQIGAEVAGPIWQGLTVKAESEGCTGSDGVTTEIRLYETEKRIEFLFTVRKEAVTSPEAIYVAFPFNAPGGKVVYEAQGGLAAPGEGQLPGSSSDWQTIQSFVAVRDQDGQILLGSDQIPLVQLGEINLGKWQPVTKIEKPHIYSWVMNNYWFTNFRAFQDGEFRWSYYLSSGRDQSNTAATSFGWGSRIPLVARVLTAGASESGISSLSTLRISAPNVALVSTRPARDGKGIILHLRELEGKATRVRLATAAPAIAIESVSETNLFEEQLKPASAEIEFSPFEVKFIKLLFN
jgi:hypothetical protein